VFANQGHFLNIQRLSKLDEVIWFSDWLPMSDPPRAHDSATGIGMSSRLVRINSLAFTALRWTRRRQSVVFRQLTERGWA